MLLQDYPGYQSLMWGNENKIKIEKGGEKKRLWIHQSAISFSCVKPVIEGDSKSRVIIDHNQHMN